MIIRLSSIGDILLCYPTIQVLRKRFPRARIDFLVAREFEEALSPFRPLLTSVLRYDRQNDKAEIRRFRRHIKQTGYDWIIDLHNSLRTRRLLWCSGSKTFRVRKYIIRRYLYIKLGWQLYPHIPVFRKYLASLPFRVDEGDYQMTIPDRPDPDQVSKMKSRLPVLSNNNKNIIIFPGARHFTKRWPLSYFAELINMILDRTAWNIILGGDEQDRHYLQPLLSNNSPRLIDASGRFSLRESFLLIRLGDALISNDSAPMHVAALYDKPQIAVFGNTVPRFGFAPQNSQAIIIENDPLACRPCSHIGYSKCPEKHFRCMRHIPPAQIFVALQQLLS